MPNHYPDGHNVGLGFVLSSPEEKEIERQRNVISKLKSQLAARDAEIADLRAAHELVETAHENRIERDLKIIAERDAEIAAMRPVVETIRNVFDERHRDSYAALLKAFRDYESKVKK